METQNCRICQKNKLISDFTFRKDSNKYRTECDECKKIRHKEYRKTYVKGGKTKPSDNDPTRECNMCHEVKSIDEFEIRADTKKRRSACLKCRQAYCRSYKTSDEYKSRERDRRKNDPLYRLEMIYRCRIHQFLDYITSNNKPVRLRKSMDFLGCSIDEFKKHVEDQFQPGMSWGDKNSFVLDHIIPVAWFDLSDPIQQDICFHYTNFQPLTYLQNAKKSDIIDFNYINNALWNRIPQEFRNRLLSENHRKKRTIRSQASK
jgi:hypothetical protein